MPKRTCSYCFEKINTETNDMLHFCDHHGKLIQKWIDAEREVAVEMWQMRGKFHKEIGEQLRKFTKV